MNEKEIITSKLSELKELLKDKEFKFPRKTDTKSYRFNVNGNEYCLNIAPCLSGAIEITLNETINPNTKNKISKYNELKIFKDESYICEYHEINSQNIIFSQLATSEFIDKLNEFIELAKIK